MATAYAEIPGNFEKIKPLLETDIENIKSMVFTAKTLFFYDTCAFRVHSNLSENGMSKLAAYFKKQNGKLIITRCILMELASKSKIINEEYINYLRFLSERGIKVVLFDEEYLFDILSECFSANAKINEYLMWAVRTGRSPVSTITQTLNNNIRLSEEVFDGKNLNQSDIYRRFFAAVRDNKEHSDNLGEEFIGICVHILLHLPGVKDGKLCVITDDKGAAGKINKLMEKTNLRHRGSKIILFSTPKLVQHMYQDHMELTRDDMVEILSQGVSGNVVVMGTTAYDLKVNPEISMTSRELAQKIMEPHGINIVF